MVFEPRLSRWQASAIQKCHHSLVIQAEQIVSVAEQNLVSLILVGRGQVKTDECTHFSFSLHLRHSHPRFTATCGTLHASFCSCTHPSASGCDITKFPTTSMTSLYWGLAASGFYRSHKIQWYVAHLRGKVLPLVYRCCPEASVITPFTVQSASTEASTRILCLQYHRRQFTRYSWWPNRALYIFLPMELFFHQTRQTWWSKYSRLFC